MAAIKNTPIQFGSINIEWNYKNMPGLYNPPIQHQSFYKMIDVDIDANLMKQVIGRNGVVFNAITHQARVSYIWHNRANNTIEVWGDKLSSVDEAIKRIRSRIELIKDQNKSESNKETQDVLDELRASIGKWADVEDDDW